MNRRFVILSPPLVFTLSAVIAWLIGMPDKTDLAEGASVSRIPRQRAITTMDSSDMSAALMRMENRILSHNPAPPRKSFDAKGMDDAIYNARSSSVCGGDGSLEYARSWSEEAPEEMFAWLVRQDEKQSFHAYILFEEWAKKNMQEALDAVFKIPDSKVRAQALISTLEVLCKSDLERARVLLTQHLSLFPPEEHTPIFQGYDSGKACVDMVSSLPLGEERIHLLAGLLNAMNDSTDAVEYWKGLPESTRHEFVAAGFSPFMSYAGSFDGLEIMMREWAEATGDPADVTKFIERHGEAWAKRDLSAALDWAHTHLKGENRVEWREKFFQVGIAENFSETLRIWQILPEGFLKTSAAEAIVRAAPESRKAEAEAVLKSAH